MRKPFSARSQHSTWRKLWYLLAQARVQVGLEGISDEVLSQMAAHLMVTDEDLRLRRLEEKKWRFP